LNDSLFKACDGYYDSSENAVNMLLDRGADVNAEDDRALLNALRSGHKDKVALLEARGANKPTLEQLNDSLFKACDGYYDSSENAVNMLLDRGADINAVDFETS
jgi:hypothetical protein